MSDEAIAALKRAVEAMPDDVELRLHLARLQIAAGKGPDALQTLGPALADQPTNAATLELMRQALDLSAPAAPDTPTAGEERPAHPSPTSAAAEPSSPSSADDFDWDAAAEDLGSSVGPAFVDAGDDAAPTPVYSAERPQLTLADVGGMDVVKDRLNASFIAPLNNPGLRQLYGKSLKGGLLMYGPPGCGKTFLARAVAGELGAAFLSIGVADVLDKWLGASERNIHEAFMQARRDAPCVVFIDELDTLGQRRNSTNQLMTGVVNQLLTELDGFANQNDGVFVLAATNQPWQIDPALRRAGRFDRTLLVLPPDDPARRAIFQHHLKERPVENIDLGALAAATDGFSGADIALVCEAAAEEALLDSVRSGEPRMIQMTDLRAALSQARPTVGQWLDVARNVVMYGEDDGTFRELRAYLKRAKRL